MNKSFDVLTFGDICVDLIVSGGDVVPEFGQKEKLVEDYRLEMGGSCSIFACQSAKLGLKTAVLGKVGKDAFGEFVVNTLIQSGVSTEYISSDTEKTGITVALNKKSGDRAMLTYNGTIDRIGIGDISDDILQNVRHFHLGSYFLMKRVQPYYPKILKKLKQYGATISLDTNWDPEEKWDSGIQEVLPLIDIFFPNENEAMAITGECDVQSAIERLKNIIPIVAVKKGKEGAVIYAEGSVYNANSLDVDVVDTVGAGDSFDGGFIYGFLSGKTFEECARIGSICGSLNTTCAGGVKGQPTLDKLSEYEI